MSAGDSHGINHIQADLPAPWNCLCMGACTVGLSMPWASVGLSVGLSMGLLHCGCLCLSMGRGCLCRGHLCLVR